MTKGVNKVILIGNLGRDPEIRYTQDGHAVANMSLATGEQWKAADGSKREKVEWHRVVAFRKLAEICSQYLSKGSQVYIEGRLQTRSWEQDGQTRYATEIVANDVSFLGGGGGGQPQQQQSQRPAPAPSPNNGQYEDDDIPF